MDESDNRPFPIQGEYGTGPWGRQNKCTIPWWLAAEAYEHYAALYGRTQSLERIAERGGFGRKELIDMLRQVDHGMWSKLLSR